ncbi:MAG: flagellar hook capping FlgD N-terminal domain-containing protein [Terracidiphilus sp.]
MNIQGFIPAISAPIQGMSASAARPTANASTTSGTTTGTSSTDLQSTFLNLLVTELQNQDPTSPVDPTEMVSQMVSLNQLDQLISINQTLGNLTSVSSTPSGAAQGSSATNQSPAAQTNGTSTAASNPVSSLAAPFIQSASEMPATAIPSALMNLYSSFHNPVQTSLHTRR